MAEEFDLDRVIEEMHEEATRRTGLTDFGPDDYRRPFAMLAEHLASPELTQAGYDYVYGEMVGALVGRLVREDEWKKHPEHKDEKIERPVVICGIPRTGTTALHKVMSMDPQFQGLDNWLTSWPKPRPPRETWAQEKGFQMAKAALEKFFKDVPGMLVTHEMVADEVDECLEVLRHDFVCNRFPSSFNIPEYDAWYQAQDEKPCYRRLADTVRLIGLNDRRTWLLKNPGHFAEMEALLSVFPDARVIITHRDPVKSIPSLTSLLSDLRRMVYKDPDLTLMGPRETAYWGKAKDRTEALRKTLPTGQFIDINHSDFHADPIGAVRKIYDYFGLDLKPEVEQKMKDWLAANPAGKHGKHTYEITDYGVTEQDVRDAMGEG